MKTFLQIVVLFLTMGTPSSFAKRPLDCTVHGGLLAQCYQPRPTPELRVALIYYGDFWKEEDLLRFQFFLEKRFSETTNQVISLRVVGTRAIPFRHLMARGYQYNQIKDPARLQRIWYWENIGASVGGEIYSEFLHDEVASQWENVDLILAVTGAQMNGNGFAASSVVVVEHPREIAWGLPGGGSVEVPTDAQVADVLIHEIGHSLSLGHANDQCFLDSMSVAETSACCLKSPSKNDIMGYCRDRSKKQVNENTFNRFEACSLDILKSRVVPLMLEGKRRKIPEAIHCE